MILLDLSSDISTCSTKELRRLVGEGRLRAWRPVLTLPQLVVRHCFRLRGAGFAVIGISVRCGGGHRYSL